MAKIEGFGVYKEDVTGAFLKPQDDSNTPRRFVTLNLSFDNANVGNTNWPNRT